MTRKHFIAIAAALAERRRAFTPYQSDQAYYEDLTYNQALDEIAEDLCRVFESANPQFDKDRFLKAARVKG